MNKKINKERRKHIGDLLHIERKNKKKSQEDIGQKLGVNQELIAKMESGKRRIDVVDLIVYCNELGLSLTDIAAKIESYLNASHLMPTRPNMRYQRGLSIVKIRVDISWREQHFSASLGENVLGAVVFTADTFAELQEEAKVSLEHHVKGMIADGVDVPDWLRDKVYEFEYKFMDAESLLRAYSQYLSLAAISHVSGISQSQLSFYANGKKKASPHQVDRIANAINKIGKELMALVP